MFATKAAATSLLPPIEISPAQDQRSSRSTLFETNTHATTTLILGFDWHRFGLAVVGLGKFVQGCNLELPAETSLETNRDPNPDADGSGSIVDGNAVEANLVWRFYVEAHRAKTNVWIKARHLTFEHLRLIIERHRDEFSRPSVGTSHPLIRCTQTLPPASDPPHG